MDSRLMTKGKLIAVNKRARKAGGNYIDPDFLALLPNRFQYPVCKALSVTTERGWVRCWERLVQPESQGQDLPGDERRGHRATGRPIGYPQRGHGGWPAIAFGLGLHQWPWRQRLTRLAQAATAASASRARVAASSRVKGSRSSGSVWR